MDNDRTTTVWNDPTIRLLCCFHFYGHLLAFLIATDERLQFVSRELYANPVVRPTELSSVSLSSEIPRDTNENCTGQSY